jgi:hypothetical protein
MQDAWPVIGCTQIVQRGMLPCQQDAGFDVTCMCVVLAAEPLQADYSWLCALALQPSRCCKFGTYKGAKEGQSARHHCCDNHVKGPADVQGATRVTLNQITKIMSFAKLPKAMMVTNKAQAA